MVILLVTSVWGIRSLRPILVEHTRDSLEAVADRFPYSDDLAPTAGAGGVASIRQRLLASGDHDAEIPWSDVSWAALTSVGGAGFVAALVIATTYGLSKPSGSGLNLGIIPEHVVAALLATGRDISMPLAVAVGCAGLLVAGVIALERRCRMAWHYVCAVLPMAVWGVAVIATLPVLILLLEIVIILLGIIVFCLLWGLPSS